VVWRSRYGPLRERLSVCLFIGALGVNFRICRESRVRASTAGKVTPAGLASSKLMSTSRSRRFPVTVTHLPVTRCQICDRTLAYRPGNISEVLTAHYRRAHPEALGIPSQ
jgi:hypothetical protein